MSDATARPTEPQPLSVRNTRNWFKRNTRCRWQRYVKWFKTGRPPKFLGFVGAYHPAAQVRIPSTPSMLLQLISIVETAFAVGMRKGRKLTNIEAKIGPYLKWFKIKNEILALSWMRWGWERWLKWWMKFFRRWKRKLTSKTSSPLICYPSMKRLLNTEFSFPNLGLNGIVKKQHLIRSFNYSCPTYT